MTNFRNGNIQSYRVLVDNGDVHPYLLGSSIASSVGGLSYSIRSLSLGKRFDIWVTATTAVGEGESSRTVTAHTQERGKYNRTHKFITINI